MPPIIEYQVIATDDVNRLNVLVEELMNGKGHWQPHGSLQFQVDSDGDCVFAQPMVLIPCAYSTLYHIESALSLEDLRHAVQLAIDEANLKPFGSPFFTEKDGYVQAMVSI